MTGKVSESTQEEDSEVRVGAILDYEGTDLRKGSERKSCRMNILGEFKASSAGQREQGKARCHQEAGYYTGRSQPLLGPQFFVPLMKILFSFYCILVQVCRT